ncbi:TolC family protein [Pararhizobium sp.]|uniref:TolC family protein n=1 Tax=Pararhizobium sp. TaxID=1977563 RepID=UPI00271D3E13|nr:TolC family protein [Pararhizobium sp.]MDO9417172.1 TolC family protein [Pararhizobium sp.]
MRRVSLSVVAACVFMSGCAVKAVPFSSAENAEFANSRLNRVVADQEPVTGTIDLYEAMARALKYNLDAKVEVMLAALKTREADLVATSALPRIVAGAGYAGRSESDPATPSTRDEDIRNADLTFSWNILDFGLSYVRARQAADDALIQQEVKRRIVNKVIEDVRTAYWRAVSYQRLVGRMRALKSRVSQALSDTRALSSSGESSPLVALTYERELIQVRREIELLEGELRIAQYQLAALMNVVPGTDFRLAMPKRGSVRLQIPKNMPDMFRTAMENRPEMREVAYRLRINEQEVNAALLDILPGFNLYAGSNYDSNAFIAANTWASWGAKVGANLIKIATLPAVKKKIDAEAQALDARSLSVAMAIMTQVHISRARFQHLKKSYDTAASLSSVSHRILTQIRAETDTERTGEQILIREEMNTLLADAKTDMAYADLQNAYANVYASLGTDPYPAGLDMNGTIADIGASLKAFWTTGHAVANTETAAGK